MCNTDLRSHQGNAPVPGVDFRARLHRSGLRSQLGQRILSHEHQRLRSPSSAKATAGRPAIPSAFAGATAPQARRERPKVFPRIAALNRGGGTMFPMAGTCSPSPRPSPVGRGGIAARLAVIRRFQWPDEHGSWAGGKCDGLLAVARSRRRTRASTAAPGAGALPSFSGASIRPADRDGLCSGKKHGCRGRKRRSARADQRLDREKRQRTGALQDASRIPTRQCTCSVAIMGCAYALCSALLLLWP